MKRKLWLSDVHTTYCPPWPCPVCRRGTLRLRKDSLIHEETVESRREHNEEYWGPEHIQFVFSAWADCTDGNCKQSYSLSGKGGVEQYIDDVHDSVDWYESFTPISVIPTLDMIEFPSKCPPSVRALLKQAFALYWADAEACASRLRSSLEALLTHIGVPALDGSKPESATQLSLHRRIEIFEKESPQLAQHLMALKWLGNSGSHGRAVGKGDLLDALELLEFALAEILEKRSERLAQLAARLTAKHGPK